MKTHIAINTANLQHNLHLFTKITGKPVMFVVKANAYGHGLPEVVAATRHLPDIALYAVDSLAEAQCVRSLQKKKPILVLGWSDAGEAEDLVRCGFVSVVPSPEHWQLLQRVAKKHGRRARVHLKIETGTNRLGIDPARAVTLLQSVDHRYIDLQGVYSHFANIEDTTDPAYANMQLKRFLAVLRRSGQQPLCRHFSSSAATLLFPDTHFDMARIGISAYGYWPSKQTHALYLEKHKAGLAFKPVLSWYSKVAQVKHLGRGAPIGYGLTYKTFNKSKIVVVPVGYYDGYDRKLSNAAQVLVNGIKAPVRGRICMNMLMADVSHLRSVKVGDTVTLLGGEGKERIDADMLADWAGTINYEILARINPLIPRIVST